jgi:hypothetical protein
MWDGNMDGIEPRPYNVGNHENIKYQVQMKDYFPELVNHIDSAYRTIPDRNHRGITGFSMGGFMALYLGGKYPDMVCSVVSLAGSPEFFVGYPENHTLYPVRYTFKNLEGVNVRMHNGDSDILYFLNNEVYKGALWEGFPLDYWKFQGGHMVDKPGETKAFEMAMSFVSRTFENPPKPPVSFTHFDLYSNFDVWGYNVESNKKESGFIVLRNVHKLGMSINSRRWLPSGPSMDGIDLKITTPPSYLPNHSYTLLKYNYLNGTGQKFTVVSNAEGRITFNSDGSGNEIGIYKTGDPPCLSFLDYNIDGKTSYLRVNQQSKITVRLINRGNKISGPIRLTLKSNDNTVTIKDSAVLLNKPGDDFVLSFPPVEISSNKQAPRHADPSEIKFCVSISAGLQTWNDDFVVPVMFDVPAFKELSLDDGKTIREKSFGRGNADGIANPGERIMVYEGPNRLRLYTDDPYVIAENERLADEIIPAIWPDGYTVSSIIQISPKCPANHEIECLSSYETKTHNPIERKVIWGKVRIKVK